MRIVALTTPGHDALLRRAAGEHQVRATDDAEGAENEVRHGCDVLIVDAAVDGARRLAGVVRADPDLLATAVVALLDDPADVAAWGAVADDVLLSAQGAAEILLRMRSAARRPALRGELHQRTVALEELAYSDGLTGLPNRRYLEGRLEALLSASRRHGHSLTVLLADLDRFKDVNDRHGHQAGDRLLVAAAEGMRGRMRVEDVLGRWGGDEFLAVLPETGAVAARAGAERLRVAVSRELRELASGVPVGLSVGLATWDGEEDTDQLLHRVDEALYAAKRAGRDRIAL